MIKHGLLMFSLGLFASLALAQAPQRLIIAFEPALTAESGRAVQHALEDILDQAIRLAESSSDQRWIVVLEKSLNSVQLHNCLQRIQALPEVHFAEMDSLMQAN